MGVHLYSPLGSQPGLQNGARLCEDRATTSAVLEQEGRRGRAILDDTS